MPSPLLPAGVARIAGWLPFCASLGAPVEIALGLAPIGPTLALQRAWVRVLIVVGRLLLGRGPRRYGAVGA